NANSCSDLFGCLFLVFLLQAVVWVPLMDAIGAVLYWAVKGYVVTPLFLSSYIVWFGLVVFPVWSKADSISRGWFVALAESWFGLAAALIGAAATTFVVTRLRPPR